MKRNDGFTLVEILLTIVLVGTAMLPLLTLFSRSLSELMLADERDIALRLAERELESIRAQGPDEARLRESGERCSPASEDAAEQIGGRAWRTCRKPVEGSDPLEVRVDVYRYRLDAPNRHDTLMRLVTLVEGRGL